METNETKEFIIRRDCFGNIYTQTELVRCKDCKRYYANGGNCNQVLADWFCADGEPKQQK